MVTVCRFDADIRLSLSQDTSRNPLYQLLFLADGLKPTINGPKFGPSVSGMVKIAIKMVFLNSSA